MTRSLSPLESKLILHLEWEKQPTVTIEETMALLGCSYNHARQILHRLAQRRWLAPLTPGKYELIPAERGQYAFPDTNPLFIGSTLVEPYYFSYATAATYHGLSTQAAATVYIATSERKAKRLRTVRDKDYRLIYQPPHKFFGAVEVEAYGSPVQMAEPEKTLIDALDQPAYAGDIPEIAAMMRRGQERLDWERVIAYALRFDTQTLLQRLGYLSDRLRLPLNTVQRTRLQTAIGKSTCYLGRPGHWGTGGNYEAAWRIINNIPPAALLAEIEVN